MAVEQEQAWEKVGITVSQIIKEGGGGSSNDLDLLFSGRKTMSGIPIKSSANADQTRVDFLDLSHWGRAVLKDIDFYEVNGNTVFPIYGASGGLAASYIFYFDTAFQVLDDSPRNDPPDSVLSVAFLFPSSVELWSLGPQESALLIYAFSMFPVVSSPARFLLL